MRDCLHVQYGWFRRIAHERDRFHWVLYVNSRVMELDLQGRRENIILSFQQWHSPMSALEKRHDWVKLSRPRMYWPLVGQTRSRSNRVVSFVKGEEGEVRILVCFSFFMWLLWCTCFHVYVFTRRIKKFRNMYLCRPMLFTSSTGLSSCCNVNLPAIYSSLFTCEWYLKLLVSGTYRSRLSWPPSLSRSSPIYIQPWYLSDQIW